MSSSSTSLIALSVSIFRYRSLLGVSTERIIKERFRGASLGPLWMIIIPLLTLGVYTFVFSVVFQVKFGSSAGSKMEFAFLLFAGMIVYNLFAECINQAPGLILNNSNFVNKVVYPLEILVVSHLLAAVFQSMVWLSSWFIGYFVFIGLPPSTAILAPFIVFLSLPLLLGVMLILASLGVFLRDITQLTGILTMSMLFLSPIFYPISALPPGFQQFILLNPLTLIIENIRMVLYWGTLPNPLSIFSYLMVSCFACWLGFAWFQRTRNGFADVI